MNSLTVLSPCKINLFLYITGRNERGYHNLQTLFALLGYGDDMSFELTDDGQIALEGFDFASEDNLIVKAARALEPYKSDPAFGVRVAVTKRIPMGGGLGGGSSNAATTLMVLNKLWQCRLSDEALMQIGAKLGADVPIFIFGRPAFAEGIGEKLTPVSLEPQWAVVVTPHEHVDTKEAFSDPDLKRDSPVRSLEELMALPHHNDFLPAVAKSHPKIGLTLDRLVKYGPAQLSGSGSSCFVLFNRQEQALQAQRELSLAGFAACFAAPLLAHSPLLHALSAP